MDIVAIDGTPFAKRGKKSGRKQVWELPGGSRLLMPAGEGGPEGGIPLLCPFIRDGVLVQRPSVSEARERLLASLGRIDQPVSGEPSSPLHGST
jgi:nicotinate phosphoribosyltransferase